MKIKIDLDRFIEMFDNNGKELPKELIENISDQLFNKAAAMASQADRARRAGLCHFKIEIS